MATVIWLFTAITIHVVSILTVFPLRQVVLAVLGAAAAAEDQQADDATYVSTYAAHPYPLAYTAGYPYTTTYNAAYHAPAVYNAAYSPLAYSGVYHGYTTPLVHSLKKRSVSDDEDQQADDATFVSTYAGHPYPLAYTAGYPYRPVAYAATVGLNTPASTAPLAYAAHVGYPYHYGYF